MPNTSIYHIANGHSTKSLLEAAGENTPIYVWNEVFSEGPTHAEFSTEFWNARNAFMQQFFSITEEEYSQKATKEIECITNIPKGSSVHLWYEYDFFCQINLIALLAFMWQTKLEFNLTLHCAGLDHGKWHTLAHYNPKHIGTIPTTPINEEDLQWANQVWNSYSGIHSETLSALITQNEAHFPYLRAAFEVHFLRFPGPSGKNLIEEKIILEAKNGISFSQLLPKLFANFHTLGIGDAQYFRYIKNMQDALVTVSNETVTASTSQNSFERSSHAKLRYAYGGFSTDKTNLEIKALFGF